MQAVQYTNSKFWLIILTCILVWFLFTFYGAVILNPNSYMFSGTGDGIKNYFTFFYHVNHDTTMTQFEGMNYPYGDSYLYSDCHPFLSNLIKFSGGFFPTLKGSAIGILNLWMILSIAVTAFCLYFLLIKLQLPPPLSLVFSITILLYSPQLMRLTGHFSLSYSWNLPLTWLLLLTCREKWLHYILLGTINLILYLTHPYLGLMCSSFTLLYFPFRSFTSGLKTLSIRKTVQVILAGLIPLVLFIFYSSYIDTITDRNPNPSGFFLYNAEPDDVFVPHHGFIRDAIEYCGIQVKQQWEAWSYPGIFSVVTFVIIIFLVIRSAGKYFRSLHPSLQSTFWISLIFLVFAFGVPFKQFPDLLDYFPWIKQFRATGRFTWLFYYASSILATYAFALWYKKLIKMGRSWLAYLSLVIILGISVVESMPQNMEVSNMISQNKNIFSKNLADQEFVALNSKLQWRKFQCIIPLPFNHTGSEVFSSSGVDSVSRQTMRLSSITGIPLFSSSLSRTSVRQSKKHLQFFNPDCFENPIIMELNDEKPVLILADKKLNILSYQMLVNKSSLIMEWEGFRLYEAHLKDLFSGNPHQHLSTVEDVCHIYHKDTVDVVFYDPFDSSESKIKYRGDGAFQGIKKGSHEVASFELNKTSERNLLHLGCWMNNSFPDALNDWFRLIVEEKDDLGETINSWTVFPEHAKIIDGNWSWVDLDFTISSGTKLRIYTIGKERSKSNLVLDELIVWKN